MTTNHTPTPWEARTGKAAHACIYVQGTDHDVAIGMRPDDAAHICRCVNAHDKLVAALEDVLAWNGRDLAAYEDITPDFDMLKTRDQVIRAALAKVQA